MTVSKIARVNLIFWIMKICATTLGETAGDLMSMTMNVGYALSSLMLVSLFVVSLAAQLRAREFHPALFWLVILTTSTAGTTMSDFMDRSLGLGYAMGSLILAVLLGFTLGIWWMSEKSLSVSQIRTRRAEIFYWLAILVSNTLGTAAGDYLADDSGLGFLGGAILVGVSLFFVVLLTFLTRVNRTALFWIAFVLTRPFGATFGDLLTKSTAHGGLGFGTIGSSAILAGLLAALVIYTHQTENRSVVEA